MSGYYEVHCHILPGIDDGAGNMEEAVQMLQMYYRDGVRTIYVTPHYRLGMFEPSMEAVRLQFANLQKEASRIGDGICLELGCEFHANMDMVESLKQGKRPAMGNSRCVLTEFSSAWEYSRIRERCYELVSNGYEPVIAHAERYAALVKKPERVRELVELGAYMQINAESLLGAGGFTRKRFCRHLMQEDLIHFIGSDAHDARKRIPRIGACRDYLKKKMGVSYMERILTENPRRILKGER